MKILKNILELLDKWVLSPYVRVITGYNKAVIYNFKKEKVYQISKSMGMFLNEVLTKIDKAEREVALKLWIIERKKIFSEENIQKFKQYINKLKKLEVLFSVDRFIKEKIKIPVLEQNFFFHPPYFCTLELTSRCNFRCPHCYLGDKSSPQDLEFGMICRVLRQIKELGVQLIYLTGGEIFLRKDLYEIITIAHGLGLEIEIATNGSLLSDEALNIIEKYVKKIQISLYGFSKETYIYFSDDPFILDKVILNIEKLQRRNPSILELAFTITPYNYYEVDKFYRFSQERGVKFKIGKTLPIGLALKEKEKLLEPRYTTFLDEVERKYIKKRGSLFRTQACTADKLTVLPDGRVVICSLMRDPRFTLGNIYCQDIKSIWYEKAIPYIKSLYVDNFKTCKICELKYLCGGMCPALWSISIDKSPPCKIYPARKYLLKTCES